MPHGDTPMCQNWYAKICQRAKTILSYNQFTYIYGLEFFSEIQAVKKNLKQSARSGLFREDEPILFPFIY